MKDPEIDWVRGTPRAAAAARGEWVEALKKADAGNLKPLVALLRSPNHRPSQVERIYIADFLARHTWRKPPGNQATPAYRETRKEARLNEGLAQYRYYRRRRYHSEEALQLALRAMKRDELYLAGDIGHMAFSDDRIDELVDQKELAKLAAAVKGQRSASRRKEKRRKAKSHAPNTGI